MLGLTKEVYILSYIDMNSGLFDPSLFAKPPASPAASAPSSPAPNSLAAPSALVTTAEDIVFGSAAPQCDELMLMLPRLPELKFTLNAKNTFHCVIDRLMLLLCSMVGLFGKEARKHTYRDTLVKNLKEPANSLLISEDCRESLYYLDLNQLLGIVPYLPKKVKLGLIDGKDRLLNLFKQLIGIYLLQFNLTLDSFTPVSDEITICIGEIL